MVHATQFTNQDMYIVNTRKLWRHKVYIATNPSLSSLRVCLTKTGCLLISAYCSLTNLGYITALVQLYSFVRITKKDRDMFFVDKLKALGISACINFMVYHTIASILLSFGVKKRKYKALNHFFKFHLAITIFTAIFAMYFLFIYPELILVSLFLFDFMLRFYSLFIVNSLYHQFKSEEKENELMNMQNLSKNSYGAVDESKSTPSHHVTFTLDSSKNSVDLDDLDESKDELRSMP
ncbi:hypothetical protein PVAND_016580 [Polypedilum vanderplanki]|uniref:Uncharacterized protein n=1 Tax=Polypedilum vanderplanki TaxID=319348 RepID=A0A9J6BFU3_POLVA|nr:hypothetical protein PVAND_016580 [Polypedilum vanderplanki]